MRHLIFDFDGTIVESGPLVYSNLLEYCQDTDVNWHELRDLPSNEVVAKLGLGKLDLPKLILKIRASFKENIAKQPLVAGLKDSFSQLKDRGFELHVVTSNSKENVDAFFEVNELSDLFSTTSSFFTIFGKARGVEKVLKEIKSNPEDSIYIGDETRDIEAAQKIGMRSLAVTWGYNTENALQSYNPDYLARSPQDMVQLLCEEIC